MTLTNLDKAPFPWFGGKSLAAPVVWAALGDVDHYVEPFAGGLGVLLNRPHPCNRPYHSETVNDLDGFIVNAWRAIQFHPEETARWASWPVTEADKTARQLAVIRWRDERTLDMLAGSAEWCDPKMAGWWMWGVCVQIGAISGPWVTDPVTGRLVKQTGGGVARDRPHITGGQGVNNPGVREPGVSRSLPHISDDGRGVNRPALRKSGVARDLPHISDDGRGVNRPGLREPGIRRDLLERETAATPLDHIADDNYHDMTMPELIRWFRHLSARLRHVRILNGDWTRVVTRGALEAISVRQGGTAGVFLDPPYTPTERDPRLYNADSAGLADAVREWCITNGDNPRYRIVLAGYDTEHRELETHGWQTVEWYKQRFLTGGMANIGGTSQQHRERLWLSPHCNQPTNHHQQALFTP